MGDISSTLRAEAQNAEAAREYSRKTGALVSALNDKFDQERTDKFCDSVLGWLDPPRFTTPFEQAQDAREDGTAEWLFEVQNFQTWRDDSCGSILWVKGSPGWGKTVLAASTVQALSDCEQLVSNSLPVVCYYFFYENVDRKPSRLGAYRAIAAQLFQQCHHLEEIHNLFSISLDRVRIAASEHEILDLLRITLSRLSNVFFVLDGIDECQDNAKLLRDLQALTCSSRLKSILFGRPNIACLRRFIDESREISMSREVLDKDIALFLDSELLSLQDSSLLPADIDISACRNTILQRADGMFLWARLMICYLNSTALTRTDRTEEMSKSTPEGLDDMYFKIFNHIKSMDRASRELASRVFMWVGYARSYMTSPQIKEAVWGNDRGSVAGDNMDDIDHGIIVSCCGLIEKRQNTYLHFMHPTARDFILSPRIRSDSGISFVLPKKEASSIMAQRCISYLMHSVPAKPLGGIIHKSASLDELRTRHPFLEYGSPHWANHSKDAIEGLDSSSSTSYARLLELGAALEEFLSTKIHLMVWFESLYTFVARLLIDLIQLVESLAEALSTLLMTARRQFPESVQKVSTELTDLASDLRTLHRSWGATLRERPQEIWNDVTVFSPSRFFIQTSAAAVAYLPPKRTADLNHSKSPLFSTSSNSPDGQLIASLSIWAPRAFSDFWEASPWWPINAPLSEAQLNRLCLISKDWVARFELFAITDTTVPKASTEFPLDDAEILLVIRQSLRSSMKCWTLKFPIKISDNLSTVVVLRTVFALDLEQISQGNIVYCSTVLPMNSFNWSQSRSFFGYTYSYQCHISFDSQYIVHQSYDLSLQPHLDPLTIFRISNKNGLKVVRLKTIKQPEWNNGHRLPEANFNLCVLHPQRLELIFTLETDRDTIWWSELEREMDAVKRTDHSTSDIKEIGFSACGNYFTVTSTWARFPAIYPLHRPDYSDHVLRLPNSQAPITCEENNTILRKRQHEDESAAFDICSTMQVAKMPKIVHTRSTILVSGADSSIERAMTLSHSAAPQSIDLAVKGENSIDRTLSLFRVPGDIDLKHAESTVMWPSEENGKIQIILNAATKRSYDSYEIHTSPCLPAVLSRDPRSLAHPLGISTREESDIAGNERSGLPLSNLPYIDNA